MQVLMGLLTLSSANQKYSSAEFLLVFETHVFCISFFFKKKVPRAKPKVEVDTLTSRFAYGARRLV